MGWIQARVEINKKKISRLEYIGDIYIPMPNLDYFIEIHPFQEPTHYILEIMEDLGWFSYGVMDKVPLSYMEIKAYLDLTHKDIDAYFIPLISKLSKVYLSYSNTDIDEPHPSTNERMVGMTKEKLDSIRNL